MIAKTGRGEILMPGGADVPDRARFQSRDAMIIYFRQYKFISGKA
jgi:hypothetical protein